MARSSNHRDFDQYKFPHIYSLSLSPGCHPGPGCFSPDGWPARWEENRERNNLNRHEIIRDLTCWPAIALLLARSLPSAELNKSIHKSICRTLKLVKPQILAFGIFQFAILLVSPTFPWHLSPSVASSGVGVAQHADVGCPEASGVYSHHQPLAIWSQSQLKHLLVCEKKCKSETR